MKIITNPIEQEYRNELSNLYNKHINRLNNPQYTYTRFLTIQHLYQVISKRRTEVEDEYKHLFQSDKIYKKLCDERKKINGIT